MTGSRKHCWLHIGVPKTGTTSLQRFLAGNAPALAAAGLAYPDAGRRAGGHHDPAFLLGGGYPDWATPPPHPKSLAQLGAELRSEIAAADHDVVLSSENFYLLCDPEPVRAFLESIGFRADGATTVVVYLRRQDDAAMSWYNQAVKAQGFAGDIGQHIRDAGDLWNYARRLERWASCFGEANLRVCIYDGDALRDGDIRRDFLDRIGVPAAGFEFAEDLVNAPINSDLLRFQRQMNRLPLSAQEKRLFHKELIALSAATAGSDLFADAPPLSHEERLALLGWYEEGNRQVARRFLGRDRLFSPPHPPAGTTDLAEPGLTGDKIAAIVGWLLVRSRAGTPAARQGLPHD